MNAQPLPLAAASATAVAAADSVRGGGLDAPISYEARYFENDFKAGKLYLIGNAVIKYQSMTIEAGKITVNTRSRTLIAEPLPDTLGAGVDSLRQTAPDSSKLIGYPVFTEGNERIVGDRMEYNFDSQKGRVVRGRTEFGTGKYGGKQIKKVTDDAFNVSHGLYTTCEADDPHFHFSARRMKIIVGERVIAKPIVLYLGKVPVAALPFGVFPTKSGRRSGLIVPRYGQSATEGRYLRELGYYWAINDYLDARLTADYYDRSGWLFKGGMNYAKRYGYTGSISGSLTRKNFSSGLAERRWDLRLTHNQTLSKTARISASGRFASDNSFYKDFSTNQSQRLQRQIVSQATYSKSWPKLKASMSLNVSETKDLETDAVRRNLPQLSFNFSQRPIFARKKGSGSSSSRDTRWWESIYLGFTSGFNSSYNKQRNFQFSATDTTSDIDEFDEETSNRANHRINLRMNSPSKLFGKFQLSQSMTIREDWFDREFTYEDSTLLRDETKGFYARHLFDYSASASTKIYGFFQPNIGGLTALRHVMTPSLSMSFAPDYTDPFWGYFVKTTNSQGEEVDQDRFVSTPRGRSASMNIRVNNVFQAKVRDGEDERKLDLFNVDVATGYNIAAEQNRWNDLSTRFSARPGGQMNVNLNMRHSFYGWDEANNRISERLLVDSNGFGSGKWFRLTSLALSSNFSISGQSGTGGPPPAEIEDDAFADDLSQGFSRFEDDNLSSAGNLPWKASFALSWNLSRFNPTQSNKTAYLTLSNAEVNLTQNWRVRLTGQFDLVDREVVRQNWSIYRDIHCWEASLNWNPIGPARGFYLRLNVKAPELRDLKVERRGGRSSVFGGGYNF